MQALRITGKGGPEVLRLEPVADPVPGPAELLVRVRAAALNRADLLQCLGMYPAPVGSPPDIPGLEYAGEVVAVGEHVRRFKAGDKVMGLVGGGAFAELLVTHEREAIRMPAALPFQDAAALPEAVMTAFDALVLQGGLAPGDTVVVHAVASGVGTAAAQLVRAYGGTVIGTSRSKEKLARVASLGVDHPLAIDTEPPHFAAKVKVLTSGRGATLALDLVGGSYFAETVEAMAPRGRVLLVGLLAGASAEVPLRTILQKRLRVFGTVLRSRPLEEKIFAAQAFETSALPLIERGAIRPVVDAVHPFTEAAQALGRLSSNATLGKVVLSW